MVEHPGEYFWSSYRANAQQEPNRLISQHEAYLALGKNNEARQQQYRETFKAELCPELIDQVRVATNSNYALGSENFRAEIEEVLGRRAGPGTPGRPRLDTLGRRLNIPMKTVVCPQFPSFLLSPVSFC